MNSGGNFHSQNTNMLQMTSLWKTCNKPRERADYLIPVGRVSSPCLLKDYMKILEEQSSTSSTGGKDKLRLQHRPSLL